MSDDPIRPEDEKDALAAELALRVLPPADEAEARAEAERDPDLGARVDAWNARLATLADETRPVEPSPAVWPRVEAALPATAGAAPLAVGANDNERIAFWRRWAVGSTGLLAASLIAVVVLLARPEPVTPVAPAPTAGPVALATLTVADGGAVMTLAYDNDTGTLYLAPTQRLAGDRRVPHLWLMRPDQSVQLVGAVRADGNSRHSLKGTPLSELAGQGAIAVAVSMEAPGHTPAANKPDGEVIASGALQRL